MRRLKIAACIAAFFAALGLTVYPLVSNWLAERYQSSAIAEYTSAVSNIDTGVLAAARQAADAYNREIASRAVPMDGPDAVEMLNTAGAGYDALLDLNGDGIMGFVRIPAINIVLPIYHGVEGETLEDGAGHLPGSSLPVGGPGTHAVIAAHSGLASQRMFSDLEQLKEGDLFYFSVLGDTLAYEVDQIKVVEPDDASDLGVMEGGDFATLVTCTPFGINTHRLLVRGRRVALPEDGTESAAVSEATAAPSTWREQYVMGIVLGLCILAVAVLVPNLIWQIRCLRRPRRKHKHER